VLRGKQIIESDVSEADHRILEIRDFPLECGVVLPRARLAWHDSGGDGAPVLTCTAFAQTPADLGWLRAAGGPLDPARRRVISTEMLGNGRSSSPSNTAAPFAGPDFPPVTIRDNVALQAHLLDELGVERVASVVGASMGGQQALQWAVSHPGRMASAVAIVASARATLHAQLFLQSLETALTSDPAFAGRSLCGASSRGLERLSETWAPWATSPEFFSGEHHQAFEDTSAADLEGFLAKWRTRYLDRDANDLISQLRCWRAHDLGTTPGCGGSLAAAAARAAMPVLFLPSRTDAYFAAADVRADAALFPDARVEVIDSVAGHAAGFGRMASDREAVARALEDFLAPRAPSRNVS
jgi:homoserine O-acetyltransferase